MLLVRAFVPVDVMFPVRCITPRILLTRESGGMSRVWMADPSLKEDAPGKRLKQHLPVICVDLDGTLVATDTLWESLVRVLVRHPRAILPLLAALFGGKARFKAALALHDLPDVAGLPYRQELLEYLRAQKASGRRLVLATAADHSIAEAVAAHLGCFDEVVATGEHVNLRGKAKGELLAKKFGEGLFCYAGDSTPDLDVWRRAGAAIPVCVSAGVMRKIPVPAEASFPAAGRGPKILARALRVHQWVKNLLVFVPLFTSRDLLNISAAGRLMLMALALSIIASAQYLLNDLVDLETDRQHAKKKRRPFASGDLSIQAGLLFVPLLILAGSAVGYAADAAQGLWLLASYFASSIVYSFFLKTRPLADVFTLAGLYTFRIVIGGFVSDHHVTAWLLNFSFLCFLSLGFLKRYIEVAAADRGTARRVGRRGYYPADALMLALMGVASSFAGTVVLALYVYSESANLLYSRPLALWGIVPICLLVQCRLWLSASRGYIEEDPVRYVLSDRVAWAGACLSGLVYLAAIGRI